MSALKGTPREYDPTEDWGLYCKRMTSIFACNKIVDDQEKVHTLLSYVGMPTFKQLDTLAAPKEAADLKYADLVALMQKNARAKPLVLGEIRRFHRRDRLPNETVLEYSLALQDLAQNCEFADKTNELRNRFLCGLQNEQVQQALTLKKDLTFDDAVEFAAAAEMSQKEFSTIATQNASALPVHKLHHDSKPRHDASRGRKRSSRGTTSFQPVRQPSNLKGNASACSACGSKSHTREACRFRDATCHGCGKTGHIKPVCRSVLKSPAPVHAVEMPQQLTYYAVEPDVTTTVNAIGIKATQPIILAIKIANVNLLMEMDTGAGATFINLETYTKYFSNFPLQPLPIQMNTYGGTTLRMEGVCEVPVRHRDRDFRLPLCVATHGPIPLLGRDWLEAFGLLSATGQLVGAEVFSLSTSTPTPETLDKTSSDGLDTILERHANVFRDEIGCYNVHKVHIDIDPAVQPIFLKNYPVPLAMKPRLEEELRRLQDLGIITPVASSKWATPIMHVLKSDGTLKIAGCYNRTINKAVLPNSYPLPLFEDVAAKLSGGETYSTLDMNHAYNQLELDAESKLVCTINTHLGLFTVNRLFYGISSAPAIFQREMDKLTAKVESTQPFIDDSAVTGATNATHLCNLDQLLGAFNKANLTLNRKKCKFLRACVQFLGLNISKLGITPVDSKLAPLRNAMQPTDVLSLKSFLGLINYYGKFINNLSTLLEPLYRLTRDDTPWTWGPEQHKAWTKVKAAVTVDSALAHYDAKKQLYLTVDASPVGVGAFISHIENGIHRPIAFASSLLSSAQKNYAQIDREGLAIVYGVRRFHHHLFGRKFILRTDHKPLVAIFGEKKGCNQIVAARLHRWAIFLSAYDYAIEHVPAVDNQIADGLSRNPQPVVDGREDLDMHVNEIFSVSLSQFPVSQAALRAAYDADAQLQAVLQCIRDEWKSTTPDLKNFYKHRFAFSTHGPFLFLTERLVVPEQLRRAVLAELHAGHFGIVRTKSLARSTVWWPSIDRDIESMVRSCDVCQRALPDPPKTSDLRWPIPDEIWGRIHLDFAGPFHGKMFLLAVDARTKWCEVRMMTATTSKATIAVLKCWFKRHGLPIHVHSDNGPQFTSAEFVDFLSRNGIRQTRSPPFHPATNGAVEGFVKTFKNQVGKFLNLNLSISEAVDQFLIAYRSTPHVSTRTTPSEAFLQRTVRTRLHLLNPRLMPEPTTVETRRSFEPGELVFARDYLHAARWVPGIISQKTSSTTYDVAVGNAIIWNRHADQLRKRQTLHAQTPEGGGNRGHFPLISDDSNLGNTPPVVQPQVLVAPPNSPNLPNVRDASPAPTPPPVPTNTPVVPYRHPQRIRNPTQFYGYNNND